MIQCIIAYFDYGVNDETLFIYQGNPSGAISKFQRGNSSHGASGNGWTRDPGAYSGSYSKTWRAPPVSDLLFFQSFDSISTSI